MELQTKETTALKQPVENDKAIVINQIVVRNIDRTMKDIATWRNAHIAAERVIWPVRQRLYDLYSDVIIDGHLSGIIKKRFSAVTNKKIYFKGLDNGKSGAKENEKIEELEALIKSKAFRNLRKEILNTILWGITGIEFIVGKEFAWMPIPRKHIKPEYKVITKEQFGYDGFDYPSMAHIMVMGESHDLGLLLNCCPYALWKRGGLADYAQFVEIFGQPVRIFKYDAYDVKTKQEVQTVADETAGAMSLIIPKQAEFEMMDGKTANANGDLQEKFIKMLNDELSVIILGNTQTTTSSEGSGYAQSKTHGEQQMQITADDMDYEMMYLNSPQFLKILADYGYPVAGGEFVYEQEADVSKLAERIKVDEILTRLVPMDDEYFYDTYHVPKPENYEVLKSEMVAAKALANQPPATGSEEKPTGKKPKDNKPAATPDPKDLADELDADDADMEEDVKTAWGILDKYRLRLANFFAPAPKD